MNNSVFGKTMENLKKRVNVKLVNDNVKLCKLIALPSFDAFRIFSKDLAAVNMKKTKLYLNRPIYVGFPILDLSKHLMYGFHNNYIKEKYKSDARLLFIYDDMLQDVQLLDKSEYRQDNPLHSTINKKFIGKMKDETHGIPIQEFVGLRPKMYSITYTQENMEVEKKTANGIKRSVTRRNLRHESYKECLLEKKQTMATMNQIRSEGHKLLLVK